MKRTLIATLLAAAIMLALLPAAALAAELDAEPDTVEDASEIGGFETPVEMPETETDAAVNAPETGELEMPMAETDAVVDSSKLEYVKIPLIDPRYPSVSPIDNSEDDPSAVQLADRRAVKCIDRLKLPQFARNFYYTMERESKPAGSSGLGRDGVLIDPSQSRDTQTFTSGDAYVMRISFPSENELRNSGFQFADYPEYIRNCVRAAFYSFEWDHPEVFWLEGYGYYNDIDNRTFDIVLAYEGFPSDKSDWDIRAEDYQDTGAIKNDINALNQSVDSILREAGRTSSNYDKITYFNEWLTTNNQYNYTVAYTNNSADRIVYTSLSALTTKDGNPGGGRIGLDGPVCSGYAKAFLLLCQEADIPCTLVSGANHAWNYVQPDSSDPRWYAMDVTWNDPTMYETPTLAEYLAWKDAETTAYTLVGSDTIVYDGKVETFLDQHPDESGVSGNNFVHANFKMGPELNRLAYVDSLVVQNLDVPAEGAVPDTSVTLSSAPKSGHHPAAAGTEELFTAPAVTWSPALTNGRFAAGTAYTATISYTPRRQGYGLTSADASKITVPGAESVSVGADGSIRAVFPKTGGDSGSHGKVSVSVGDASSQGYSGAAYAARNEMIVIHVTPDPGYQLGSIQVVRDDNGQAVPLSGGGSVYTFAMPESDVSVHAVFSKR